MSNDGITDQQLREVTVGELKPLNSTIEIVDYDPSWPALFTREAERIESVLGDRALRIEHVGSTSVPELAAKPIIDIILVVADSADESSYIPLLQTAGYVLRIREPEWFEHRLLKGPDTKTNLHCFSPGCPEIESMVLFRDWLRSHGDDRRLYEQSKRELAVKTWRYVQNYADAKSLVVREILDRARSTSDMRTTS